MTTLLSIDPGIRGTGAAIFQDGLLTAAAYVKNFEKKGGGPYEAAKMAWAVFDWYEQRSRSFAALNTLVLEWPQTYSGRASRGDTNDLFPLAGVDAALAVLFPGAGVTRYTPHEWKGSVDGDVMIERIKGRLSDEEKAAVTLPSAKGLAHNVFDACGVGLKFLGRLDRHRSFPRD